MADKGPWSKAARAKREETNARKAAEREAAAKGLGPAVSVPFDPNEKAEKKRKYTKQQPQVHTAYDRKTVMMCINKLMEML